MRKQLVMTSFKRTNTLINKEYDNATKKSIIRHALKNDSNLKLINQNKTCFSINKRDGYDVASTRKVLYDMANLGFYPIKRNGSNTIVYSREASRKKKYVNHATHMLAFSSEELVFHDKDLDNELKIVVLFINSYHKRTQAKIIVSLWRTYCSNGLMVPMELETFSRPHLKTTNPNFKTMEQFLTDAVVDIKKSVATKIIPFINSMKNTVLTEKEQKEFARNMFIARLGAERFEDTEGKNSILWMDSDKLLTSHRDADVGDTLWLVANRIQENGGGNARKPVDSSGKPFEIAYKYIGKGRDGELTIKERKLTTIGGMTKLIKFNKEIFIEAQKIIDSKTV